MSLLDPLQWSQLSRREKVLFAATIGAILYAFIFLFYRPRVAERQRLDHQKSTLQKEVGALSSALPDLMKKAETAKREDSPFLVAGIHTEWTNAETPLSTILEEISRQARLRGVQLMEMKPGAAEKKEEHEILPIQIKMRSRFINLGEYIVSLERLPRPIRVDRLKIESTPQTSPDVLAEMTLHVLRKGGV